MGFFSFDKNIMLRNQDIGYKDADQELILVIVDCHI